MDPRILILPDAMVYKASSFYGGETRRHSGVVLLSLSGDPIVVRSRLVTVSGEAILVAPGVARTLHAPGGHYLSIQIEPQHRLYRSLLRLRRAAEALAMPVDPLRAAAERIANVPSEGAAAEARAALDDLAGSIEALLPPEPWRDRRMQAILERLVATPPAEYAFDEVLRSSGLSASRFSHAFSESVGLSLRGLMLWRKTSEAVRLIGKGRSLTHAAHEAGFADSAHLTKTFHSTLGLLPSQVAGVQIAQV